MRVGGTKPGMRQLLFPWSAAVIRLIRWGEPYDWEHEVDEVAAPLG
jgi:hypothetical protein